MATRNFTAILDDFNVMSTLDYQRLVPEKRMHFERLLYAAMELEIRATGPALRETGGLKFRFDLPHGLDAHHAYPSAAMMNKMAFYSSKTLVTFPIRNVDDKRDLLIGEASTRKKVENKHRIYWGDIGRNFTNVGDEIYKIDRRAFADFLGILIGMRRHIEAGVVSFVPEFPNRQDKLDNKKLGLVSANFRLKDLEDQFKESRESSRRDAAGRGGIPRLFLPHFSGLSIERVLEIREKHAHEHAELQRRLEQLITGASQTKSETLILGYLRDADSGVREMERRYRDIISRYKKRDVHAAIGYSAMCLVMLLPVDPVVKAGLLSILGAQSINDYVKIRAEKQKEMSALKGERFFLPWLVSKID